MSTSTPTLQSHRDAAAVARARAEDAQRKAAAAQAVADAATEQAHQEATERLRRDARQTVDTFDATDARMREALSSAREAFNAAAVTADSLTGIRDLYVAWLARATDVYILYRALSNACGRLEIRTWKGRAIPSMSERLQPPPFSEALDTAITRAGVDHTRDLEEAYHDRIHALERGEVEV